MAKLLTQKGTRIRMLRCESPIGEDENVKHKIRVTAVHNLAAEAAQGALLAESEACDERFCGEDFEQEDGIGNAHRAAQDCRRPET